MALAGIDPATVLLVLLGLLVGLVLEFRFGLVRRVEILIRTASNAEAKARLRADYGTDLAFDSIKDEWKSILRETYGEIAVETDGSRTLKLVVADHFTATLTREDGAVEIRTNKIVSTMRGLNDDLGDLFDALDELHDRNTKQTEQGDTEFAEERFELDLELPYRSKYLTYHLPFGTALKSQRFVFEHTVYDWTASFGDRDMTLETANLADMRRLAGKVLGPFISF